MSEQNESIAIRNESNVADFHISQSSFKLHYDIFANLARDINAGIFVMLIIVGVVFFHVYNWHLGNLTFAEESNKLNLKEAEKLFAKMPDDEKQRVYQEVVNLTKKENLGASSSLQQGILTVSQLKVYIIARSEAIRKLRYDSFLTTMPFTGIKVLIFDYIIFLCFLGLLAYFWIFKKFNQTKQSLKSYLNDYRLNSSADETIMAVNFLIYPDVRGYKYIEWILKLFSCTFIIVLLSNTYEVFFNHQFSYSVPLHDQPGFAVFQFHVYITYLITLIGLAASLYLYKKTTVYLLDIRNQLIILRWFDSLKSALFDCFEKRQDPLVKGRNFIEYREYKSNKDLELVLTVQRRNQNSPNALHGIINLPERLKVFHLDKKNYEGEKKDTLDDKYIGRILTREEELMKEFFSNLISDDSDRENRIANRFATLVGEKSSESRTSIERIRILIGNGNTGQAIKEAKQIDKLQKDVKLQNELILISSRFEKIEEEYRKGILSSSEYIISQNKVVFSFIEFLTVVDK